jgi:hypothetical protein
MTEATGNRRTSMRATDKPFNIDKKVEGRHIGCVSLTISW